MKALMLGGDFWHSAGCYYHMLKTVVPGRVDFIANVAQLRTVSFDEYDVLYITRSFYEADASGALSINTIAPADEKRIAEFVESGHALCLLHAGVTIREENILLQDIAKGRFIMHPPLCRFRITFEQNLCDQNTYEVEDELYHVTTQGDDTQVFAWAHSEEHGTHIAGWRHAYGKGRVAVFTPGHASAVLSSGNYKETVRRISTWLIEK